MNNTKDERRTKKNGFVGVSLVHKRNYALYNTFIRFINENPELNQSRLIREALREYFKTRNIKIK